MQFSLKWLLVAIAFVAVSLVAMLNANELWQNGFRTAVLFSMLFAVIGALWSVGTVRAFWGGYAIVALCYLTRFFGTDWGSGLITTNALSAIHSHAFTFTEEKVENYPSIQLRGYDGDIVGVPASYSDGTATILVVRPKQHSFIEVGHAVLSVVLGVMGGIIAAAFYRRRPKPAATSA
jgi:hypothetical protein